MSDATHDVYEYRDALLQSIRSGVLSVTVQGQTTTFTSIAERQRVLNQVNAEIALLRGTANPRPIASTINLGGF